MHDGILLEQRGLPAAVLCTDVFIPTADASAQQAGLPGYRYVALPHPIGRLSEPELRQRAMEAVDHVERILLARK